MEKEDQEHDVHGEGVFSGEAVLASNSTSPELRSKDSPTDAAEADAAATLLMHLGHSTRAGQAKGTTDISSVPPWTSDSPDGFNRVRGGPSTDIALALLDHATAAEMPRESFEDATLEGTSHPEDEAARNLMLSTAFPPESDMYKSGVQGVRWNRQYHRWGAIWREEGRQRHKYFSALKYGFYQARMLAIAHRRKMESHFGRDAKSRSATPTLQLDFSGATDEGPADEPHRRGCRSDGPPAESQRRSQAGQHILPDQLACLFMDGYGEYDDDAHIETPFSSEEVAVDSPYRCKVPGVIWDAGGRCWKTKWVEGGRKFGKTFPAAKHGFERAKELAIAYRYRLEASGRLSTSETHVRHIYASATPPKGVSFNDTRNCFVASWRFDKQTGKKKFSVAEHGFDEAKVAATAYLEALCAAVGVEGTDSEVLSESEGDFTPPATACNKAADSYIPEILSLPMLKRSRGESTTDQEPQRRVEDVDHPRARKPKLTHQTTASSSISSAPNPAELSNVVAEVLDASASKQSEQNGAAEILSKDLDEQLAMFFVSLGTYNEGTEQPTVAAEQAKS